MPQAYRGLIVQVPTDPDENNGKTAAPAVITQRGDDGPGGTVQVNLHVFPDGVGATSYGLTGVLLHDYEEHARLELFGEGAWPLDG